MTSPHPAHVQNVAVNVPPTTEAALIPHMGHENIRTAIEASTNIQLQGLRLQGQQLDRKDDELQRRHTRSMKLLDLRAEQERGSRNFIYLFGTLSCIAIIGIVLFLLYKEQYETAKTIITLLVGAIFGYLGGRVQSVRKAHDKTGEDH